MDIDPITGILWDTENGPNFGDEINLVTPGFNSGWKDVMGLPPTGFNFNGLVTFNGNGKYSDPEFVWKNTVAPTALLFFNSDKFGPQYKNDMFVGDYASGRIYHFELNPQRDGLLLNGSLSDKQSNSDSELQSVIFGEGFGVPTDLKIGPDGMLNVVSLRDGAVYKISEAVDGGGSGGGGSGGACQKLPISKVAAIGDDGTNHLTNAIDNNLNTRWSNNGRGSWIQADLGSKNSICSVDIAWYRGNLRQNSYTISASNDGISFTNVLTGKSTDTTTSFEKYNMPTGFEARYVRITVNDNTENNWASITEIALDGSHVKSFMTYSSDTLVVTRNYDASLPTLMNPEE